MPVVRNYSDFLVYRKSLLCGCANILAVEALVYFIVAAVGNSVAAVGHIVSIIIIRFCSS